MDFSISTISKTKAFKKQTTTKTQLNYYLQNNADIDIMKLVQLSNKAFGEKIQSIIKELLGLSKSTSTGHDAIKNKIKFEIKASRYWAKTADFTWQHIMTEHVYDYLILVGIDFNEFKIYLLHKNKLLEIINENDKKINIQGGAGGQGYWCSRNSIITELMEIKNKNEFDNIING